jgi:anaerobic ribonucleoside-triphosphate reductase activating protein
MNNDTLLIHKFLPLSLANGPGRRAVIWVQGCSLNCYGCFNPKTHNFNAGETLSVHDLFDKIASSVDKIDGITISGGEPMQQAQSLQYLLRRICGETSLSVILFSGYTWNEILQKSDATQLLKYIDVLLAGRYNHRLRLAQQMKGSENKTTHILTSRYNKEDLQHVPSAEVIISDIGEIVSTGVDPICL